MRDNKTVIRNDLVASLRNVAFPADTGIYVRGEHAALCVSPRPASGGSCVDLVLAVLPLGITSPLGGEAEAGVRQAIEEAKCSDLSWVREAAAADERRLNLPRVAPGDLTGLVFALGSNRDSAATRMYAITAEHGRATFRDIPKHWSCTLDLVLPLTTTHVVTIHLPPSRPHRLAAHSRGPHDEAAHRGRQQLENGILGWARTTDTYGHMTVDFVYHSSAPAPALVPVHIEIRKRRTGTAVRNEVLLLKSAASVLAVSSSGDLLVGRLDVDDLEGTVGHDLVCAIERDGRT